MTFKDRLTALLSAGYFPAELPPVFTTEDFGQHALDIIKDWKAGSIYKIEHCHIKRPGKKKQILSDSYVYKTPDADAEVISKPKRGYERRGVHVTHPIPQALLSSEISENWKSVQKWLLRQTYSLDEIQISRKFDRSIKGINFPIHRAKKSFIEAISDWVVKTDITRFYPSIYTHSIAWAAYGKRKVKDNLTIYKGSLADRLDILVRSCNRNQTVGIPIGPETSRIISEVISSRIDDDFSKLDLGVPKTSIDRLQDDWFLGVDTLEHAEKVLSGVARIYREYGLEINGSKTSIDHILAISGESWRSELGSFLSHKSGPLRGNRLREFLHFSLRLQSSYPADPVINYTMSVIEGRRFSDGDIEALESFLLKAAVLSPISMDKICRVIINIDHDTGKLSKGRISKRFCKLAEDSLEKGYLFEAIWLIYTIRGIKKKLSSKRISEIMASYYGSVLPLILLDMKASGLLAHQLPIANWERMIDAERVKKDPVWLLAYEGIRRNWLSGPKNILTSPFFDAMNKRNVVFYDPRKNVQRSRKVIRDRKTALRAHNLEARNFLLSVRGFGVGDSYDEY